jgi:hypothetical protein
MRLYLVHLTDKKAKWLVLVTHFNARQARKLAMRGMFKRADVRTRAVQLAEGTPNGKPEILGVRVE